jgi:4-carboxymuconolactone decarboxylase
MNEYQARLKRGEALSKKMGRTSRMQPLKELYPPIYELTIGHVFGDIWTRPHLDLREREMITLAANIALGRQIGIKGHFQSALHIGIPKEKIMELIIQVGHYAGWPTMAHAALQYIEMEKEEAAAKKKKNPARRRAK